MARTTRSYDLGHLHSLAAEVTTASPLAPIDQHNPHHLIVVHGFLAAATNMLPMISAVTGQVGGSACWTPWLCHYDSTWTPFATVGHSLVGFFRSQYPNVDFSKTIFLGYSEGGLISRQMISEGFPCRGLVSVCTPHEGILPMVPLGAAMASMQSNSPYLKTLNNNSLDQHSRALYHCFAVTYHDHWGNHPDDTVVGQQSALMENLGQVAQRGTVMYDAGDNWYDISHKPHVQGQDPGLMAAAVQACASIMNNI